MGCGLCRVWAAVWPTQVLVGATVPGQVDHTAHWGPVPANVHDVGNGDKIVRSQPLLEAPCLPFIRDFTD